jgi:hypothetical protein
MSQSDLARAAVVPVALVTDFEMQILTVRAPDLDAIQHALERAGIEFIDGDIRKAPTRPHCCWPPIQKLA